MIIVSNLVELLDVVVNIATIDAPLIPMLWQYG